MALTPTLARADVPGPRPVCDAEGLECSVCWQSYGGGGTPNPEDPYEQCAAPLRQKGWVEACRNRQGAGDNVYFCAAGQKPEIVTRGGGCAGCAAEGDPAFGALGAGLLLGLTAAVVARRRRRRSGS